MSDVASFPVLSPAAWRSSVERELAGKPFDKTLVHRSVEGLAIEPLYTEAPALPRVLGDGAPFRVCMRHGADATAAEIADDLEGGADALWLPRRAESALPATIPPHTLVVIDEAGDADVSARASVGGVAASLVSTLDMHLRGADACDEIAFALSGVVARLTEQAPLLVRVAAGRDTFIELCKLRALRLCLRKVLKAAGTERSFWVHAVASPRTVAARDPWVNLLRVSTELFAAVLGGADWVTPLPFDEALSASSPLGRRIARNSAHVLREEAGLGRVVDPGAGSYYLDALTDRLAREAWSRFQAIEAAGGLAAATTSGLVEERLAATRAARRDAIAKRRLAVLGVSEFANLGEQLPSAPLPLHDGAPAAFRDDAPFEEIRARLAHGAAGVTLVTLGTPAEARARVDFATAVFASVGVAVEALTVADALGASLEVACLCGTDDAYAAHAAEVVPRLRERGARRIALAGRPIGGSPRDAGIDAFVFLGCDVPATLATLLEVRS